jgi:hypothetical protein
LVLALLWWPAYVLLLVVQLVVIVWPASRYYMTVDRDAVIAVIGTSRNCWIVFDHMSACPGVGSGRDLRRVVFAMLCEAADERGIVIETTAVTRRVAEIYRMDLPGVGIAGTAFPRGKRMRREPDRVQGPASR